MAATTAAKIIVVIEEDLDGGPADETVRLTEFMLGSGSPRAEAIYR